MKKAVFNKSGMRQLVNTGYKKFDNATNYISTGNVIANTQYSLYIRPYCETKCNNCDFPEGHLLNYDMRMINNIPQRIREILSDKARKVSYILYKFFVGDTVVGWVVTDNEHKLITSQVESWCGDTWRYKKYNCLQECIQYITA